MSEPSRTRLAPSPTGALHLGNARTFLVNWAIARQRGWRVVLRIEDLDSPRTKPGATEQTIETLQWLGLDWDEGPFYQINDLKAYHAALAELDRRALIYPCRCTRKEIQAAQSAPHDNEHDLRYPGTCRPAGQRAGRWSADDNDTTVAWRVRVPDEVIEFGDCFAGKQRFNVQRTVGDFVVASKAGLPAYQLAVVVDDARQGIDAVVRGDDLISSTPRQLLLYRLLGLGPEPTYWHLPLVLGEDGHRLAKRHGDTRLTCYQQLGVPGSRVLALLGRWCGLGAVDELSAADFAAGFDIDRVPAEPIVFTRADDAFLTAAATTKGDQS